MAPSSRPRAAPLAIAALLAALTAACGGGGGGGGDGLGGGARCEGLAWQGAGGGEDADGDGLSNAQECALGLDPHARDTDGDGLPDGEELALGTNPRTADTDGDGVSDGQELALGTNPWLPDTDGDGVADGEELAAGLDPLAPDSDGDGLSDGEELAAGLDPLSPDSDGDGLPDGDEVALGFDPSDPSDPPAGTVCELLAACARDALVPVQWAERLQGDYRLALPASAVVGELVFTEIPDLRVAAVGFDLRADGVAGFLLSIDEPVDGGSPSAQLNLLATRLSAATGTAPWTATERVSSGERAITSWDGYPAVVGARFNLTGSTHLGAVRSAALAAMANIPESSFVGLPGGPPFGVSSEYVMVLEVLSRRNAQGDAGRTVVVAAIAPRSAFEDKTQPARILVSDVAGGTSLGQHGDGDGTRCDSLLAAGEARADFVWMSDISGSTDDERTPIRDSASAVFTRLADLGIDFRMGVVKHTPTTRKNASTPATLLSPGFTRTRSTFEGWWSDTSGSDGNEFGLTAIDDVVNPSSGTAMPRSATEVAGKVREGVKLVVVYVSDEHPQEVENACSLVRDACNQPGDADYPCPDLTGNACVASTIEPFVANLVAEDAIAFGIIAPPPSGCATSYEVGWGYAELIEALGGSHGSVCASDPGQTLDDIVSAVAGATSSFRLRGSPIAITLKVVVTPAGATCDPADPGAGRREVARSQLDGFDYDPVNNTIFFVGPSRPRAGDTVTVSYREWVERSTEPNPDPGGCPPDCGGCGGGAYCDVATCTCIPIG